LNSYIIDTARLGLRAWTDEDVQPFIEMNKDPEVMRYFPATLSEDESKRMLQRIKSNLDFNKFGLFAVEKKSNREFIGFTGFAKPNFDSFFTPCMEIGWRYRKEAWGHGYATEAAKACLQYGFDVVGFDAIFSFTAVLNTPSEHVMKKIGMTKVGEFEHPKVDPASKLRRHVVYKISK
jgi:ribosomal-protein-alanine N-acetyltransferase